MKKIISFVNFLVVAGLSSPLLCLAQDGGLEETRKAAGLPSGSVPEFLGQLAGALLALAGSIFLFLIIYGGIIIMTSAGTERVAKGQKIITWAVIGVVVLGAAYAITSFIFGIFQK